MKCDELTPIELECNMGKDINGVVHREPWKAYDIDEVDAAIAELKSENKMLKEHIANGDVSRITWIDEATELKAENERLKDELNAANNQCENLINSATDIMLRQDKVNDSKCTEIESLKCALWLARANNARNSYLKWNLFANFESEDKLFTMDEYDETPGATDGQVLRTYTEWMRIWENIERKCLKKAEEYK